VHGHDLCDSLGLHNAWWPAPYSRPKPDHQRKLLPPQAFDRRPGRAPKILCPRPELAAPAAPGAPYVPVPVLAGTDDDVGDEDGYESDLGWGGVHAMQPAHWHPGYGPIQYPFSDEDEEGSEMDDEDDMGYM